MQECHEQTVDTLDEHLSFRDILVVPGYGHIEINAVRALFKLGWDPLLKDVAIMCGFKTPTSLKYCKGATNHHKSWEIVQVMIGLGDQHALPIYTVISAGLNGCMYIGRMYIDILSFLF